MNYILKSYKLNFNIPELFDVLSKQENCFFFDSSLNFPPFLGRYSFLGTRPFRVLKKKGGDPFKQLRENLSDFKLTVPRNDLDIPFWGGAVGYLAYDLGFVLEEKIKKQNKPDIGIPDAFFGFYNTLVIIDHFKNSFYILSVGYPEKSGHYSAALAHENFRKTVKLISKIGADSKSIKTLRPQTARNLTPNFTRQQYIRAVKKAKEYIRRGDIYQVNLTQQFKAQSNMPSTQIYKRLREYSPSCFGGYFDAGDFQIISSSPEQFLKLNGNNVTTRPMKGTRPRAENRSSDAELRRELLKSEKDKAELTMIVDLERNDLGRACAYNSIKVVSLRELEEYSTVFQTTATIEGTLHKDKDRIDLLRACFPGGSIIGCPKIRAMQIIEELEPSRRSIYTGCMGYLSFSQDMDFNILIRSILKKDDKLYFGVGGGIVADSDPEKEYEETLVKAQGIFKAINVSY